MSGRLLDDIAVDADTRSAVADDYERFASGLPDRLEEYVLERYRLDLSSEYGGLPVKNPFGKGSGQLSLNVSQVSRDAREGLGFVVLKTIIAEDDGGGQSMSAWAIPETRMAVERIEGSDGTPGWTVTWKGRGWYDTFEHYLEFFGAAMDAGAESRTLVVPSCKYHLPRPGEVEWRDAEYAYTTGRLVDVWASRRREPMPIEKDFSPTLAGSDRAAQAELILEWLARVPELIRRGAGGRDVTVGLKLFNAVFDDDFQFEMLRGLGAREGEPSAPDFLVYANRLFDANREFEGVRGVAYGGPDLSARNLRVLARYRELERAGEAPPLRYPLGATGDVRSGRVAAEYLLRGASTFQMHTLFQLSAAEYRMPTGGKTARALHELLFNPVEGFLVSVLALRRRFDWPDEWNVKRLADAGRTTELAPTLAAARPSARVEVRSLAAADLPSAARLVELSGWNQTERDWRRLAGLAPEGCFAATADGRVVATTTTTAYGRDLAWIGMVLVDPEHRRRGIASRLVREALEHLDRRGVAAVALDATPQGRPVYAALGFEETALVERWEAAAPTRGNAAGARVEAATDGTLDELLALDRGAFGADRSELLRGLARDGVGAPLVAIDGDEVVGGAFARAGRRASYVGPVLARDVAVAAALLDAALATVPEGAVFVDVDTRFEGARELLEERGFAKQRDLYRMVRGELAVAESPGLVFAIAGPEVG